MASVNLSTIDAYIKKRFDGRDYDAALRNRPALAVMPKSENFTGRSWEYPLSIGNSVGRSASFADAVTAQGPGSSVRWSVTRVKNYVTARFDGETIRATRDQLGAFVEAVDLEMRRKMGALYNDHAHALFRDGTGVRGTVASIAGTVVTLTDANDAAFFDVGMTLEYALAGSGATGAVEAGNPTVTAVDEDAGTITVSAAGTIAAGTFLFQLGDAANGGSIVKMAGLDAWLDPAAGALFGVTRTTHPSALAGNHLDASAMTNEEAFIKAGSLTWKRGGAPDVILTHPDRKAALELELSQRTRYTRIDARYPAGSNGEIGFDTIALNTGSKAVKVLADHSCPTNVSYMLTLDTWDLKSNGPLVAPLNEDDLGTLVRAADDDAYDSRIGGYANLMCKNPRQNTRITHV